MDDSKATIETLNYLLGGSESKGLLPRVANKKTYALFANFKRVLYPLDLFNNLENLFSIHSLGSLCCEKIIRDVNLLKNYITEVPIHYDMMMKSALDNDNYEIVVILMTMWPDVIFPVSKVVTNVFNDWNNLLSDERKFQALKKITTKFIRCLMIFLVEMKNDSMLHLRVLDLRGMPMGDRVIGCLADELLSLPSDAKFAAYHIVIDCAIYTCKTFKKVKKCLASELKPYLHFNKLDLSHLSSGKSSMLLKKINPTSELVGLCFPREFFKTAKFIPIFNRFTKLTALEISCSFDENRSLQDGCALLPLQLLRNLRRLAFCGPTYMLREIVPMSSIQELKFLDLTENGKSVLTDDDLQYLVSLPLQVSELNLHGHIFIRRQVKFWTVLFGSLVSTLTILELEKCIIVDSQFPLLLRCILTLVNLRYLNLASNCIRMRRLREHAWYFRVLSKLESIRLPYDANIRSPAPDDRSAEFYRQIIEIILVRHLSSLKQIIWGPYLDPFDFA